MLARPLSDLLLSLVSMAVQVLARGTGQLNFYVPVAACLAVFAPEARARILKIRDELLLLFFVCLVSPTNRSLSRRDIILIVVRGLLAFHTDQSLARVEKRLVVLGNPAGFRVEAATSRVLRRILPYVVYAESGPTVQWIDHVYLPLLRGFELMDDCLLVGVVISLFGASLHAVVTILTSVVSVMPNFDLQFGIFLIGVQKQTILAFFAQSGRAAIII